MIAHRLPVIFAMALLFPSYLIACDWDTETLLQERSRFPSALEIILGKFPRHTPEYYQWRLQDRLKKLESDPNNDLMLDDVAVSLEKLKRYDEAIEVAQKQLERNPDRYESIANLGTFYIHDGQLAEGLKYIERAIEVNPDAHFGREKYQAILVKYVMQHASEDGIKLPLGRQRKKNKYDELPFVNFLLDELIERNEFVPERPNSRLPQEQLQEATKGILGMMRFSRYNSPILLEVLGEIQQTQSANQLAYRAFLSAAQNTDDKRAKEEYKKMASDVVAFSLESLRSGKGIDVSDETIAEDFQKEQKDASEWFAKLASDEKQWIASGQAVDVKFNEKYRKPVAAIVTDRPEPEPEIYVYRDPSVGIFWRNVILIALLVVVALGAIGKILKKSHVARAD